MNIKKTLRSIKILEFIRDNPNCNAPEIRDYFGIIHQDPPSLEQKDIYKTISYLRNQGLIEKQSIENKQSGGAQFHLKITDSGLNFLKQLGFKGKNLGKLEASIRFEIRQVLATLNLSKPLYIDLTNQLGDRIINLIS